MLRNFVLLLLLYMLNIVSGSRDFWKDSLSSWQRSALLF